MNHLHNVTTLVNRMSNALSYIGCIFSDFTCT